MLFVILLASLSAFTPETTECNDYVQPAMEKMFTTTAVGKFQSIADVRFRSLVQADCGPWWYDHAYGTWQRTCVQGGGTIVCYDVMVCYQGSCVIVSHSCCGIFGCS